MIWSCEKNEGTVIPDESDKKAIVADTGADGFEDGYTYRGHFPRLTTVGFPNLSN